MLLELQDDGPERGKAASENKGEIAGKGVGWIGVEVPFWCIVTTRICWNSSKVTAYARA